MVLDQDLRYELYRAENGRLHIKLSNDRESIEMPISNFDPEDEEIRHELVFVKYQINIGCYRIGNVIIPLEYQALFNEIMADDNIHELYENELVIV